ncbi:hypothetical protein KA517_01635 [Candidatus Gracilibacteria bacterium]|nr:hypothetical protein [Candidatus Gracilibacteria bacterium]
MYQRISTMRTIAHKAAQIKLSANREDCDNELRVWEKGKAKILGKILHGVQDDGWAQIRS